MGPFVFFLLSFCLFQCGTTGILLQPNEADIDNYLEEAIDQYNALVPPEIEEENKANLTARSDEDSDHIPLIRSNEDETEVTFKEPIASVSIDYSRNVIILNFQKKNPNYRKAMSLEEASKRKAIEGNFMRFGKRVKEDLPLASNFDYEDIADDDEEYTGERQERSLGRNARGDNFMRFGRAPAADFMRFGRNPKSDFMRLGRAPAADFMRFGRAPAADFMRFGRSSTGNDNFIRFGRTPKSDFMRLGRTPKSDFMRLGRSPQANFMRLGRSPKSDFMRLGRSPKNDYIRFGRSQKTTRNSDKNFMRPENYFRLGRSPPERSEVPQNFMRFGKSSNDTGPFLKKDEILEAAKVLHKSEEGGDENNPIDKAIKVLYKKHKNESASKSQESKSAENFSLNDLNSDDHDPAYTFTD